MHLIAILFLCTSAVFAIPVPENKNTLVLLHVVFRHGDRTPLPIEMYPNDPYVADVYFEEGLGELTKAGKKREYEIGRSIRKKYDTFLGSFKTAKVSATTTDYVRTKMSCLLVLAGLYPPEDNQIWNTGFNWQPIPYDYIKYFSDFLLGDPNEVCPRFIKIYKEYLSAEGDNFYRKNKKLYDYVSQHTGLEIKTPRQLYNLQFVLNAEEAMGLELPAWTKSVWPANITKAAADEYFVSFATPQMKRLAGGPLLKKIIDDSRFKIQNTSDQHKIYLYSVHENNIAYQLMFFKTFYSHVPPYGSYIVLELHKFNDVYGYKIYYEDYTSKSGYMKIPKCGEFCPFDKFVELMKDNLPTEEDVCPLD